MPEKLPENVRRKSLVYVNCVSCGISIKWKIISVLFSFLISTNFLLATTMICVIPKNGEKITSTNNYIELIEPKTTVKFDVKENISKIYSPGGNKFERVSRWTKRFILTCNSSNSERVSLEIDMESFKFEKTYFKKNYTSLTLPGFCKKVGS